MACELPDFFNCCWLTGVEEVGREYPFYDNVEQVITIPKVIGFVVGEFNALARYEPEVPVPWKGAQ